jgi:hypothetical protein
MESKTPQSAGRKSVTVEQALSGQQNLSLAELSRTLVKNDRIVHFQRNLIYASTALKELINVGVPSSLSIQTRSRSGPLRAISISTPMTPSGHSRPSKIRTTAKLTMGSK